MIYWFLSILTALIASLFGNIDPKQIASNLIFHKSLRKMGMGNSFMSTFTRMFGWKGWVKYGLTEILTDVIPVLIAALLFSGKGHSEEGMALAGFCLTISRMWPVLSNLHGSDGFMPLIVSLIVVSPSAGFSVLVVSVGLALLLKYVSIGTFASGLAAVIFAVIMIDNTLTIKLVVFTGALVLIRNCGGFMKAMTGAEERISFRKDLTYKLDERF